MKNTNQIITSTEIKATTRKLRAKFSLEAAEDLRFIDKDVWYDVPTVIEFKYWDNEYKKIFNSKLCKKEANWRHGNGLRQALADEIQKELDKELLKRLNS